MAAIDEAGVPAGTRDGREFTGVWVGDRKIGSIGIHVSRRVSMHGFAVNVDNDLAPFTSVVACGLPGVRMTSLREEGSPEGVDCFRKRAAHAFARELRPPPADRHAAAAARARRRLTHTRCARGHGRQPAWHWRPRSCCRGSADPTTGSR